MNPIDVVPDVKATLGGSDEVLLTDVRTVHQYDKDGTRTEKVLGTAYSVVCPKRSYKPLTVKVLDKPQEVSAPEDGQVIPVRFDGLELYLYWRAGSIELGARAKGIAVVNPKNQ